MTGNAEDSFYMNKLVWEMMCKGFVRCLYMLLCV